MSTKWLAQAELRRQMGEAVAKLGDKDLVMRRKRRVEKQATETPTKTFKDGGMVKEKRVGKSSSWISHVKAYQKQHGCSYREAMVKAKASYQK
jgi:hypothetical protein